MKNAIKIGFIILIFAVCVAAMAACSGSEGGAYTVIFNTLGGKSLEPIITSYIETEPVATYENNVFRGWYTNENYITPVNFPFTVEKDTTLYAKWEAQYKITYVINKIVDNQIVPSVFLYADRYCKGETVIPRIPEEIGYKFIGWESQIPEVMPEKDVLIIGTIEPKPFKICFNVDESITLSGTTGEYTTKYKGVDTTFPCIDVYYGNEYSALLNKVVAQKQDLDFDYWSYTNSEFKREKYPVSQVWDKDGNLLLTPEWAEVGTAGLIYNLNTDKTGYIISYEKRTNQRILVPSFHDNLPVVGIAAGAFMGATEIKEIVLPYTITSIGNMAFMNCTSLTSINIPDNVTLGTSVFSNASALTSITIPRYVQEIPDYTFYMCSGLKTVTFAGNGLKTIGNYAFAGANKLEMLYMPQSLLRIGNYAFEDCTSLKIDSISFSQTIINGIGTGSFKGCTSLDRLTLPDTVQSIGQRAFDGCSALSSINIPNKVSVIEGEAFRNCVKLNSISIHYEVVQIRANAFYGCEAMVIIYIRSMPVSSSIPSGWEENWNLKAENEYHGYQAVD